MGRKPKFDRPDFLQAAVSLAAESGPAAVTVAGVAKRLGAPVGSLYHRFESRSGLLAEVWLTLVESFQGGFLGTLSREGGLRAALYTPQWVRDNPQHARVLLLHRTADFAVYGWNTQTRGWADRLRAKLDTGLKEFAWSELGGITEEAMQTAFFVLIDVPFGAVRRHIESGARPPLYVDELIGSTYRAIIGGGP